MRAFDQEYADWEPHPFANNKEKEENRIVVKDSVERLCIIFQFLENSDLHFLELNENDLVESILKNTGIDPFAMFTDAERLSKLIIDVFQNVVTLQNFKNYLKNNKPDSIRPKWLGGKEYSWQKILSSGIAFGKYSIENRDFEVVPRMGLRLINMSGWPFDKFINPNNPTRRSDVLDSEIVAIRRIKPFRIHHGEWQPSEKADIFIDHEGIPSYVWIGRRRIGKKIETENLVCPFLKGARFFSALKFDEEIGGLKIVVSNIECYYPEKPGAFLKVEVNRDETIWKGRTNLSGRRNVDLTKSFSIDSFNILDTYEVNMLLDDDPVTEPIKINIHDHMLFSNYSKTLIPQGKRKSGERRYTLFTRSEPDSLKPSPCLKINKSHNRFGEYNIFHLEWEASHEPFHLSINDTEWYFYELEDLIIQPEFSYDDPVFSVPEELIPFATTTPSEITFRFESNLQTKKLKLYDVTIYYEDQLILKKSLNKVLKVCEQQDRDSYLISEPVLLSLLNRSFLEIGKYKIRLTRGRVISRDHYHHDVDFFVLPKLNLSSDRPVVKEGDEVSVTIKSNRPCFQDHISKRFADKLNVSLGKAHLNRDYSVRNTVILSKPEIELSFYYEPIIFSCSLGEHELGDTVYLNALKDNPLRVFGLPNSEVKILIGESTPSHLLDEYGKAEIEYLFFKERINRSKTSIVIQHFDFDYQFDLIWQTRIVRFKHTKEGAERGNIRLDEADFIIEIEGPPDNVTQLHLLNKLSETCGEKIIKGIGTIEDSIIWTFSTDRTGIFVLKALVQNKTVFSSNQKWMTWSMI